MNSGRQHSYVEEKLSWEYAVWKAFIYRDDVGEHLVDVSAIIFTISPYHNYPTRLYCLNTVSNEKDDGCHGCYDIQTWHEILGHNYEDVSKL